MTVSATKRKLPIDIQTIRTIREENHYYVDKTAYARRLVEEGRHYFLSRPRRFGKSLFLDMLKELFAGSGELFDGLDIHGHWDWSARFPVVRLDFSGGDAARPTARGGDGATGPRGKTGGGSFPVCHRVAAVRQSRRGVGRSGRARRWPSCETEATRTSTGAQANRPI